MFDNKIKIFIVFGTRPEAIKMAPIIKECQLHKDRFETIVCVTAQHREMLDQVLDLFGIDPEYDLDLMTENQTLAGLTSKIMGKVSGVFKKENPDLVFVQGDTTTTFISALSAFYQNIKVAHIEAGLRTNDKHSPFPEEINRRLTSHIADIHFAPTKKAKINLINEGVNKKNIFVTGNTVIDALKFVVKKQTEHNYQKKLLNMFSKKFGINIDNSKKTVLVTGHRRESFGEGFKTICMALSEIARNNKDIQIVYPVHLNPNVQKPVTTTLGEIDNIHLIEPLDYEPFIFLMSKSYLVLTDSGGIQEEAPSLGKPVLVMRDTTERPEGVKSGTSKLVGTNKQKIVDYTQKLLDDNSFYDTMAKAVNPYGDGNSSELIIKIVEKYFNNIY